MNYSFDLILELHGINSNPELLKPTGYTGSDTQVGILGGVNRMLNVGVGGRGGGSPLQNNYTHLLAL